MYDENYEAHVNTMRKWLGANTPNVFPCGRNGMHKYNNQDHSMFTAMLSVENILGAEHDVWAVNVEAEYLETSGDETPKSATGRDAPVLPGARSTKTAQACEAEPKADAAECRRRSWPSGARRRRVRAGARDPFGQRRRGRRQRRAGGRTSSRPGCSTTSTSAKVRPEHAGAAVACIELAVEHARDGRARALVTGPMNKEALKASGSPHPGHTEMFAALFGVSPDRTYTMFMVEEMRIFFLTRHHALAAAIALISTQSLRRALTDVDQLMRRLGFDTPRIAVAALNPTPASTACSGPRTTNRARPSMRRQPGERGRPRAGRLGLRQCRQGAHDAVISLYHDQGHIAAKTVDFFGTVSCTLGLPVIRTTAEHGTALDIAARCGNAKPGGQIGHHRGRRSGGPCLGRRHRRLRRRARQAAAHGSRPLSGSATRRRRGWCGPR